MKNSEKKQLREMIKNIENYKKSIEEMSEIVVDRCDSEREKNENSFKISKFEEEEQSLDNVVDKLNDISEDLDYIIKGVDY